MEDMPGTGAEARSTEKYLWGSPSNLYENFMKERVSSQEEYVKCGCIAEIAGICRGSGIAPEKPK